MGFLVLQTPDGTTGILVLSLDEDDVRRAANDFLPMYYHIRLSEHFPAAEELLHEHVLVITEPGFGSEDELNSIIEDHLQIDRAIATVHVCVLTSEIIEKLRAMPAESHMFTFAPEMPVIVVLLGGQVGLERWMDENLRKE